MKRSEMLRYINEAIKPHVFDKDPTYISECILSTIEGGNPSQAGMLPPLNDWALHMDGDHADPDNILYYTWEDEE